MKSFAWSYSSLNNYETCPRRFAEEKVTKRVPFRTNPAIEKGNALHELLAKSLLDEDPRKVIKEMKQAGIHERTFSVVGSLRRFASWGTLHVEKKYAFTRKMEPVEWFDRRAWFRSIVDAWVDLGKVGVMVDWKTGKPRPDSTQLKVFAKTLFTVNPEIEKVLPWFTWVMDGTKDFVGDYEGSSWLTREEVDRWWEQELLPRVNDLERAWKENDFPPRPGGLCRKYCPVGPDLCEFSGK